MQELSSLSLSLSLAKTVLEKYSKGFNFQRDVFYALCQLLKSNHKLTDGFLRKCEELGGGGSRDSLGFLDVQRLGNEVGSLRSAHWIQESSLFVQRI